MPSKVKLIDKIFLLDNYKTIIYYNIRRDVAPFIIALIKQIHEIPLRNFEGGHTPAGDSGKSKQYPKPDVNVDDWDLKWDGDKIKMRVRAYADDGTGNFHQLFYWLDFGAPEHQHVTRSAAFPVRSNRRFVDNYDNDLESIGDTSYTFTGEYRSIPAGATRPKTDAQDISKRIGERFREEFGKDARFNGWDILNITITEP